MRPGRKNIGKVQPDYCQKIQSYSKEKQSSVEPEHLKEHKFDSYKHEYSGEVTGTGGDVFANVPACKITHDIKRINNIRQGIILAGCFCGQDMVRGFDTLQ